MKSGGVTTDTGKPGHAEDSPAGPADRCFRTFMDNSPAVAWLKDQQGRYVYLNRAMGQRFGVSCEDWYGKTDPELWPAAIAENFRKNDLAVLASGKALELIEDAPDPDGQVHQWRVIKFPVRDTSGIQYVGGMGIDITGLKQAENALRENEQRLSAVMDTAPDAIISIGHDGVVTGFNRAAEAIFGYAAEEVTGRNVRLLMPSPYREEHDGYIARYLATRKSRVFGRRREVRGRRKDGSTFPLELTITEIDQLGLFVGILRDISTRRELEKEVARASTYEQERIGQEIHDGLGQKLTALSLMAKNLQQDLVQRQAPEAKSLAEIIELVQEATREVRAIAHGLAPIRLTQDGLTDALRKLTGDMQTATGIACHFQAPTRPVNIENHTVAMQLYRIAQEAVHNAIRHACPDNIRVMLEGLGEGLELSVSDDGTGFGLGSNTDEGFGLRIMRYRAAIIGCDLDIESTPDKGTVVRCRLAESQENPARRPSSP